MKRDIRFAPSAERDLLRLDRTVAARTVRAIERYVETGQGDVELLRGDGGEWRLRVGDWRVRFRFAADGRIIQVLRILARSRAYRD